MESALRHDGEPFEDEELEEMMSAAAVETAAGTTVIPYELYINKILVSNGCFVNVYDCLAYDLIVVVVLRFWETPYDEKLI